VKTPTKLERESKCTRRAIRARQAQADRRRVRHLFNESLQAEVTV
jgi:hypothetical protein